MTLLGCDRLDPCNAIAIQGGDSTSQKCFFWRAMIERLLEISLECSLENCQQNDGVD